MLRMKRYRLLLEARAAEIKAALARRQGIAIEPSADDMDRTVQAAERDLAGVTLGDEHRKLREAEAALARIDKGRFGECLRCEAPIPPRRLDAVPWAAFCIGCQDEADRLHRLVGRVHAAA